MPNQAFLIWVWSIQISSLPPVSPRSILLALNLEKKIRKENSQLIEPTKRLKEVAPRSEHIRDFPCILEILSPPQIQVKILPLSYRVRWVPSIFVPSLSLYFLLGEMSKQCRNMFKFAESIFLFIVQTLRPAWGNAAEHAANAKKINMNFFSFFLIFIFFNKVPHWNSTYILVKHYDAGWPLCGIFFADVH